MQKRFSGTCAAAIFALFLLLIHPSAIAQAGPSATMLAWSPKSPVQVGQAVTFSASATDDVRVVGFQWDFDSDEEPDAYSAPDSPGKSATGSLARSFSEPASIVPAVRAVDDDDFVSAWDILEEGGSPVVLVVGGTAAPQVEMGRWQPFSASGPDGTANVQFTFSASASSAAGLDRLEWDFDGDGIVDETTPVSGTSASATASHSYGEAGAWTPKVRAVDADELPSLWVAYMQGGSAVELETYVPELGVAMEFEQVGETAVRGDGQVSATFSFSAESDADIVSYEWDFDGDGTADLQTSSPSASHTYTRRGFFLPSVTVEDGFGTRALASPVGADGQPQYVGVFAADDDPALYDPVQTYCDGMTVEQLIASGRYNVMDFRS